MRIPHFKLHKNFYYKKIGTSWYFVFVLDLNNTSNLSATRLHPHQHCHQQAFNQRTALHNSDYEEGRALRGRGSRPTVVEGKEDWYGVRTRNYYCIKVGCNQL